MVQDVRGSLFIPNKQIIPAEKSIDLRDNWRAIETWSRPTWKLATLKNAWVNAGADFRAAYAVDGFGFVNLRGRINGGADGTTAFTVPQTAAPALDCRVSVNGVKVGVAGYMPITVFAQANGNIGIYWLTGGAVSEVNLICRYPLDAETA
jgi:hypothetical protein